jgi:hypothetical protein
MGPVNFFAGAKSSFGTPIAAVQRLHGDGRLQFAFPDAEAPGAPPGWLKQLVNFIKAHGDAFRDIGWILLAAIVLTGLYFLFQFVARHGFGGAEAPAQRPTPAWQPSADQARAMLHDADILAEQGRFAEAAHILLLVSIQEIRDRRPGVVAPAVTSREIAQRPELSPKARAVFSEISAVVERAVFGARLLSAGDFAQCRRAFERFTDAGAWDVPAHQAGPFRATA